jgi:molecular chaperone DnaJ
LNVELHEAWKELELSPGAPADEVKKAWRRLASQWHPDRNPGPQAELRMRRLNQAMECIRQWREDGEAFQARAQAPASDGPAAPPPRPARGRRAPTPPPEPEFDPEISTGAPPEHWLDRDIELSLDDAALGCERNLHGQVVDPCPDCMGTGQQLVERACEPCGATGQTKKAGWFGWGAQTVACEQCGGKGRYRPACPSCEGEGRLAPREWRLRTRIPAGVRDGDLLDVSPGAPDSPHPGIGVHLRIRLLPHPLFTLGVDGVLRCELPVDGLAWLAGDTVQVPVPGGWTPLTLVRNVVSHRLVGQGYPQKRRGARGDLELHISPQFPERFSEDQRALLLRLSQDTRARAEATEGHPMQRHQLALAAWQRALRARREG